MPRGQAPKIYITAFGKTLSCRDWAKQPECKKHKLSGPTIYGRHKDFQDGKGRYKTIEELLTSPMVPPGARNYKDGRRSAKPRPHDCTTNFWERYKAWVMAWEGEE